MSVRALLARIRDAQYTGAAHRTTPLVLVALAAAVMMLIGPSWPKDQSLNVVLGDAATSVDDVRLRYALRDSSGAEDEEPVREVAFHFAHGQAPRIIHHEARLVDGDYRVELDVAGGGRASTIERRVHLGGGSTSVDVARDVAGIARKDEP